MKIQRSIEIAAPPQEIWPYLIEPEKILKWFFLLKKFEYTGKQNGGVGATIYYEEQSGPWLMKFNFKVTEWEENKRLAFVMTSGTLKRDDLIWSLESTDAGSLFTIIEDVEMPWGFFGKTLQSLFVNRGVGKHIEEMQLKLKKLVEGNKQ